MPSARHFAARLRSTGKSLAEGRDLHWQIAVHGMDGDTLLGNLLVQMYGNCGAADEASATFDRITTRNIYSWNLLFAALASKAQLEQATRVFDLMPERDVVSWSAMLAAYARSGHLLQAERTFLEMPQRNVFSWNSLLQLCGSQSPGGITGAVGVFDKMPQRDIVSWNTMLAAFAGSGDLDAASALFDTAPLRDVVTWNSLLTACIQTGAPAHALQVFQQMPRRNSVSWNAVLQAVTTTGDLADMAATFHKMPQHDVISCNSLLVALGQGDQTASAKLLFDAGIPSRNLVSWICMAQAYSQTGDLNAAWLTFDKMPQRDAIAWTAMLQTSVEQLDRAKTLFDAMPPAVQADVVACNALLVAYSHSGELQAAVKLFEEGMEHRDSVSWNTMIASYASNGDFERSAETFERSSCWDVVSWNAAISASIAHGRLERAWALFDKAPQRDAATWNAAVACGVRQATHAFDAMPQRDAVAWNSMLAAAARQGDMCRMRRVFDAMPGRSILAWNMLVRAGGGEAFERAPARDASTWNAMLSAHASRADWSGAIGVLAAMDLEGCSPESTVFASALAACGEAGDLPTARLIHEELSLDGCDLVAATSLLSVYGRCGDAAAAWRVFDSMPRKDAVAWNAMVAAFGRSGRCGAALDAVRRMHLDGVGIDGIASLAAVAACGHAGDAAAARGCLEDVELGEGHYAAMVDLLGRSGRLEDMEELLENMPFQPPSIHACTATLASSGIHGDLHLSGRACTRALRLNDPAASSTLHVAWSNLQRSQALTTRC